MFFFSWFNAGVQLLPEFPNCGHLSNDDRISGGENAGLTQYPWLALIEYERDDAGNVAKNYVAHSMLTENFITPRIFFQWILSSKILSVWKLKKKRNYTVFLKISK
jgi:hypothetical protein